MKKYQSTLVYAIPLLIGLVIFIKSLISLVQSFILIKNPFLAEFWTYFFEQFKTNTLLAIIIGLIIDLYILKKIYNSRLSNS